jgi:hypothetical protein
VECWRSECEEVLGRGRPHQAVVVPLERVLLQVRDGPERQRTRHALEWILDVVNILHVRLKEKQMGISFAIKRRVRHSLLINVPLTTKCAFWPNCAEQT